jgi:hypothetical protein
MNLDQVKYALDYLHDQSLMFQLTGDGHGAFTVDIQFDTHAGILQDELNRQNLGPIVDLTKGEVLVRLF